MWAVMDFEDEMAVIAAMERDALEFEVVKHFNPWWTRDIAQRCPTLRRMVTAGAIQSLGPPIRSIGAGTPG
jgi:hypothetical protein